MERTLKKLMKRNTPRWIVLAIDLYIVFNTFLLAYFIRFNFTLNFDNHLLFVQLPVVVFVSFLVFLLVGSYKGVIRYTGLRDALNVSLASLISFVLLFLFVLLNRELNLGINFTIPLSILTIHFLLNVMLLIGSRFLYKEMYYLFISDKIDAKRVLIYGAGASGLITSAVIKDDKQSNQLVVGFIDDDKKKSKKTINGFPVYHSVKLTPQFIEAKRIDEIIISIQHISTSDLIKLTDRLTNFPVAVKIVPPTIKWINGDLQSAQIKSVKIEDLLGRKPIALDKSVLKKEFKNKVVLITGAAGSIGSEIVRQLTTYNCEQLILVDQSESELYNLQQFFINTGVQNVVSIVADVRNKKRMDTIFKAYSPSILFHAAAYKHVPFMEENPYEAVCVNVGGTKILADLAVAYKVEKFVMISTDKAVNPTNVMGCTKRIAEMYINSLKSKGHTKFITTRFGNVLGSNGSVIPLFQAQIEHGGPLTVTHKEITRYFMTIPEACQLVLEAGTMGKGGEIFVFDMGESIKIYDLALNMINLSGLKFPEDIDIKITGLRPGEKIYEELLANGENTSETYHEKIMIASVRKMDAEIVNQIINELLKVNDVLNAEKTVSKMKAIVPEFISNNSKYEKLDVATAKN